MIVKRENKVEKRLEFDLSGSEGNVFYLIGSVKNLAKQLGLDESKIKEEMMSGDYENAVNTFEKYFGEHVVLYR